MRLDGVPLRISKVTGESFGLLKDGFNKRMLHAAPSVFVAVTYTLSNTSTTPVKPTNLARSLALQSGGTTFEAPSKTSDCAAATAAYGVARPRLDYPGSEVRAGTHVRTAAVFVLPRSAVRSPLRLVLSDGTSFKMGRLRPVG